MFNVELATVNEDNNTLDKTINGFITYTGVLKEQCDILNPIIKLKCDISDILNKNYMYIPILSRYYFINNIVSVTADIVEISAHVDVLMTYNQYIKNLTGTLSRQEYINNPYLYDECFPVSQINKISTVPFPNKSDNEQYVLTIGSSASS